MDRKKTKAVFLGPLQVGGGAPVCVQSMTCTDTRDVKGTVAQIKRLADAGCELIRVAVPDKEAAEAIRAIKKKITIPIVADIHFNYRLALAALAAGADGLRLNPGNLRDQEQVRKVVTAAKARSVPIRIGINAGSLPPGRPRKLSTSEYMVEIAMKQIRLLEDWDYDLIKIALKAFDVPTTIEAYRGIARKTHYPLHVGITEAGLPQTGIIRSAVGIGILLYEGIGDTVRVSLSAPPQEEVVTAFEILKSLNLREHGPILVSCPSCGRSETDIVELAQMVSKYLNNITKPVKVAVMGCVVNGPGEAKDADVGIACGKGRGALFRKGRVIRTVNESDFFQSLTQEIESLVNQVY